MVLDYESLPRVADERTTLTAFLEWQRATLARKCEGLTADQLRLRAAPPSTLSLLGLARPTATADADEAFAIWRAACEEARAILAAHALDDTFPRESTGQTISARWMLTHMVEEYSRHNGHADLLRQHIDGAVGY